jgi:hypothetical protein
MTQFRSLPVFGADNRVVSEVVRGIMDGKTNNTGSLTLATGNATTTTLYDERIGFDSLIFFVPITDAAEADSAPYGAFQDSTNQTAANTTTAYAITLNTTDYSNGVYVSNSSRVNVRNAGVYNLQFSIQFKNTTNSSQDIDVWFRKNGTDIAASNSRFGVPARHSSGDPSHFIGALNYFIELAANDYLQIMWRVSDTSVSIETFAAGTSPTRPAVPSVITTVNYISPNALSNIYVSAQQQGQATVTHWANSTANKTYGYIVVG